MVPYRRRAAARFARSLGLASALAVIAAETPASAQVTTTDAKLHVFYRYGLDATRVRIDEIDRIAHIDGRRYIREQTPGDDGTGYLLLTLTVENATAAVENIPLFATSVRMAGGRTIDPAVYGPFLGASTAPAPASTTILPRRRVRLRLAVADIPNAGAVVEIVLNPNDATAQFRFRPKAADITSLPDVPRAAGRS